VCVSHPRRRRTSIADPPFSAVLPRCRIVRLMWLAKTGLRLARPQPSEMAVHLGGDRPRRRERHRRSALSHSPRWQGAAMRRAAALDCLHVATPLLAQRARVMFFRRSRRSAVIEIDALQRTRPRPHRRPEARAGANRAAAQGPARGTCSFSSISIPFRDFPASIFHLSVCRRPNTTLPSAGSGP